MQLVCVTENPKDKTYGDKMPEVRVLLNTVLLLVEYTCGTFHTVPMIYD